MICMRGSLSAKLEKFYNFSFFCIYVIVILLKWRQYMEQLLENIKSPKDLKKLNFKQKELLAQEIREKKYIQKWLINMKLKSI